MWLMTNFGFFSVVQKSGQQELTVRARVYQDLEQLKLRYLPEAGPVQSGAGTDYPFRITIDRAAFAEAMKKIVLDIDYPNFKESVTEMQGDERASIYAGVWMELFRLQRGEWQ